MLGGGNHSAHSINRNQGFYEKGWRGIQAEMPAAAECSGRQVGLGFEFQLLGPSPVPLVRDTG